MKLKGEMVIELTNTNTGAVETVQETNMITEAVNNILGLNPMGIYLKASGEYDNSVLWNGTLLPICPNMIGGILLFPAVLETAGSYLRAGEEPAGGLCFQQCKFRFQCGEGKSEPDGEQEAG